MSRPRKSPPAQAKQLQPRFRVLCREDIAMGPGKAELLEQVAATGSITAAAAKMGMSYMRAWTLIRTMQRCFKQPLLKVERGGTRHGGAELTTTGHTVLTLYRRMEAASLAASRGHWQKLRKLMA